ncbi:MAG: YHS domain-containing protein [Ignavibacteria bacterium]|jgi:YHS domain-containing protein|nr:YHS domain-containing protein [Ignavibacteria bacterium]MCU7524468.1 YHS domain-containing protein [Ignavibacteria bacterium]
MLIIIKPGPGNLRSDILNKNKERYNTMKNLLVLTLFIMLSFSLGVNAQQKDKKQVSKSKVTTTVSSKEDKVQDVKEGKPFNKVCPVSGEDLEKDEMVLVAYNGKTYGLCCDKCTAKFKKDPAKYAARLNEDGTKYKK